MILPKAASGVGNSRNDENDNRGLVTGASRQSIVTEGVEGGGLRSGNGGGNNVWGNAGRGSNAGPGFVVFVEVWRCFLNSVITSCDL